jgi:hypothetical protein
MRQKAPAAGLYARRYFAKCRYPGSEQLSASRPRCDPLLIFPATDNGIGFADR